MSNDELLSIITAIILPTVRADMEKDDLLDVITEAAEYANDIVSAVKELEEESPDGDDGEKIEVIPPRRRHA